MTTTTRWLLAATAALVAASPATVAAQSQPVPPIPAEPTVTIPAVPVEELAMPLELVANRAVVRLRINGHGPFAFLVAPDAPTSAIDPQLAELLELKELPPGATVAVDLAVEKPAATFTVPVTVMDVTPYAPDVARAGAPRGVLSLSAWTDRLVTIDYARYRLAVAVGILPEADGVDVFPLAAGAALRLPLTFGDRTAECVVDPLFAGGMLFPASYLDGVALDRAPRDLGVLFTRLGALRVREVKLPTTVRVGPFEQRGPAVLVTDAVDAAMAGAQWLGRFALTYDLSNGRARLERPQSTTDR